MIIDEIEELLENAESDKYDTASTGRSLWTFLDRQAGNRNFFFIGIMNRINKIQEQLKDRIELDTIYFTSLRDLVVRRAAFKEQLESTNMVLDSACDDAFLDQCLSMLGDAEPRAYQNIRKYISRNLQHNDPANTSRIIGKKDLELALTMRKKSHKIMEKGKPNISDEERRHQESLKLQDQHFVQQQQVQLLTNLYLETKTSTLGGTYGSSASASHSISKKGEAILRSVCTPEQSKIDDEIIKRQEKALEALKVQAKKDKEAKKEEYSENSSCSVM